MIAPARLLSPLLTLVSMVVALASSASAQSTLKIKPASLAFTFTIGDAKFPAAQTITIAGTPAAAYTAATSGGLWLSVSPASGSLPASVKASINPTTLTLGTYSGAVVIASAAESVTIPVTLTVKSPPSTLTATPATLDFVYVRGQTLPAAGAVSLVTSDAIVPFSTKAGGGSWLSVSPVSGAVFPAFPTAVAVTANPAGLAPGSYSGAVTITAPQAANKSITIKVSLTVQAGVPTLTSLWPFQITEGSSDTVVTVTGSNFAPDTIVRAGGVDLATTFVGPNVVTAILPAALLTVPGAIAVIASNPATGGGDSGSRTFTVLSSTPTLNSLVNAATFRPGPIAPGEMIVLFGAGLGPDSLTTFVPPVGNATIATTLAGTQVFVNGTPSPVIYTSATQVAALVPYGVPIGASVPVAVQYNGVSTASPVFVVAEASPGIFTSAGTGLGQAVAFNYDVGSGAYTLNSERASAPVGSIIVIYVTGEGVTNPPTSTGQLVTAVSTTPNTRVSVQIGGADSEVLYAGGVVGLASSIMQINVRVPQIKGAKDTSLRVLIGGIPSADGVTIAVK
ncbi:MAG: hypothetical protein R2762_01700 [Bryobacteraceae bacterium]